MELAPGAKLLLDADESRYGGLRGEFDQPMTRDAHTLLGLPESVRLDYMQEMFLASLRRNTDCMFFAKDAENVTIRGGELNGQFPKFFRTGGDLADGDGYDILFDVSTPRWLRRLDEACFRPNAFRPVMIVMENCRNVALQSVQLLDAPFFNIRILDCDRVRCENLNIETDVRCLNTDGINLAGSRHCFVHGCRLVTGDDCIALSVGECHELHQNCEDIVISDCIGSTNCNFCRIFSGIDADVCLENGIGTETQIEIARQQKVRNICISNCILERGGCTFNIIGV